MTVLGGTRYYKAPELHVMNAKFTKKCDVYAAGIVFMELITLKKPSALYQNEVWKLMIRKGLPKALETLLEKSLAQDPKDRMYFKELFKLLQDNEQAISNVEDSSVSKILKFIDEHQ